MILGTVIHVDVNGHRIVVLRMVRCAKGVTRLGMSFYLDPHVLISNFEDGILKLTRLRRGGKARICYVTRGNRQRIAKAISIVRN